MIALVWTRDDSPTTGLSEAGSVEIFRAARFFSYPPLAVRQLEGSRVPLGRPPDTLLAAGVVLVLPFMDPVKSSRVLSVMHEPSLRWPQVRHDNGG